MDLDPLFGLRLRTPRLVLRLPTLEEIDELRDLALGGIHPPEFMPFTVAWTDDHELTGFRAYHEMRRTDWSVQEWHLELAVFAEGKPAGIQAVESKDFAGTRTVGTGSWLGQGFQGRGIGTEMRAAALELAFRGLGAQLARSGAVDGNVASLRVSAKLGYQEIGRGTVAPRGVELPHTDVALRREDWRPPLDIEIEGLEPCLSLFGASGPGEH